MSNPIIEYYNLIESGKEVVSKKVAKVYKYLYELVTGKIKSKYYYNEIRANHAIDFIERYCKHSKGRWANKPVILELWQKAFIGAVFGIIDKETEFRRFREALLVVAKKNGKSLLASGIALYMLIADGEGGAECYSVATKKEQAKIIWQESKNMTEKSPDLKRRVRCLTSQLAYDKTNSTFKPLSSDSNTEDGLNIYLAECDEIHAWKGVELYNIVADGISARDEPLILITTTAGFIREGAYDVKYAEAENLINGLFDDNGYKDDAFLPIIYELDDRNEWTDEKSWLKANPNLGVSKKYDYLRRKVDVAIGNPINRKNVLTKEFNIPETSSEVYFDYDDIYNPITFDLSELKPDFKAKLGEVLDKYSDLKDQVKDKIIDLAKENLQGYEKKEIVDAFLVKELTLLKGKNVLLDILLDFFIARVPKTTQKIYDKLRAKIEGITKE